MKYTAFIYAAICTLVFISQPVIAEEKTVFDSWSVTCNQKLCYASQMLMVKKAEKASVVGGLSFMKLPQDKAMLTVRVSSNADTNSGIGLKIDQYEHIQVKLTQCTEAICESNIIVDEQLLSELLAGKVLAVAFKNKLNAKQVSLPFSLNGFSNAYSALNKT